jgi:hypothetical protein
VPLDENEGTNGNTLIELLIDADGRSTQGGPNRLCAQLVEQRLRVFQIGGVEVLGELAIDVSQYAPRLVATALLSSSRAKFVAARSFLTSSCAAT